MNNLPRFIRWPFIFLAICWGVWFFEAVTHIDLGVWGILPRHWSGLWGILFSPFLHGGLWHLVANTVPVAVLMFLILFFYPRLAPAALLFIHIGTGLCVWLAARPSYHIGASGVIYGYASFLFFSGIFRKSWRAALLSLLVFLLYGGMVAGVFPTDPHISWEAHLLGAFTGGVGAYIFREEPA
ncbi:Rhomboid family protein [Flexibacter flexilis DSM 6793]|uniref:Rhomboid family protein n=1 Tax=Flexibacter flexilis DSM 6793 TaxID=927664 RepID=A0A1I1IV12_9BACT|nr:rhomboid family intramembrane serine protease [Flexibacter flexilis]SFC39741.1 Rhomboid family protein [Flexibacter flexilis DSM 6793]